MRYKMIYYTRKTGEKVTIAESTFAGKRVKGTSVCLVEDTYNKDFGDKLAKNRCDLAIANKRIKYILGLIREETVKRKRLEQLDKELDERLEKAVARLNELKEIGNSLI